jgi:GNAT superfamily N-acetyltransferase
MTHIIRIATPTDIPLIGDHIESLCAHHGDTYTADVHFLTNVMTQPNSGIVIFLGETDGTSASFAAVQSQGALHTNAWAAKIHLFHIHKAWRGQGLAREMINHIRDWSLDRGMNSITVSADLQNEPTQQTYLKLGFKRYSMGGAHFICDL